MGIRSKKEFADILTDAARRAGYIDGSSLAHRTGICPGTIRTWLRGDSEPRFLQLARVAEIIHTSLDKLAYTGTESSGIVADVGEDVWGSFSDVQRAGILQCVRMLDKLNRRLSPEYDPVAMFAASIKSTSEMCDSFVGKLPAGTTVAVDRKRPSRPK